MTVSGGTCPVRAARSTRSYLARLVPDVGSHSAAISCVRMRAGSIVVEAPDEWAAGLHAMDTQGWRTRRTIQRKPVMSAALQTERRGAPRSRSDVSKAAVVAAMTELVDAGLASWRERADGHLELHVIGGGRWLFTADRIMRLA